MSARYAPHSLHTLAPELLERIALETALAQEPHRPSPGLAPLLRTCKRIHAILTPRTNKILWANVFRGRFDTNAPERRLGPGFTEPDNLVHELHHRVCSLQRIRNCYPRYDVAVGDLWTMYLMLLESDGRNDAYLLHNNYAVRFIEALMHDRNTLAFDHPAHWFNDTSVAALCAWILWLAQSKEDIAAEPYDRRRVWNYFFQPFIIAGFRYPSFYAPDTHQMIPPEPLDDKYDGLFAPSPDGRQPTVFSRMYFGRQIKLAAPLATTAAMLIAHSRYQLGLGRVNPAAPVPTGHYNGPTDADVAEYEANARVVMPPRRDWARADHRPSSAHDHDWARMVSCTDPLALEDVSILRSIVYEPGMLSGCFSGTIVTPDLAGFTAVIHDPLVAPSSVQWAGRPLHFRLREHHALDGPAVLPGLDERQWGDDVLNAWLPRDIDMVRTPDELVLTVRDDDGNEQRCRYATYHAGREEPYAPYWADVRQRKLDEADEDEWMEEGEEDAEGNAEFVRRTPSFVKDIIITGETDGRHGNAWGHYSVVGRIRPWDGLVILLRTPTNAQNSDYGRWIFRGYIHGGNFIGRWREAPQHASADQLSYEGAFVLTRAPTDW